MTPTTFTARSPEDLLAVVPVVLGFVPEESVVMLTFGAARTFHARVDLPRSPDAVAEVVAVLLDPARRHRVRRVVFVAYAADEQVAGRAVRALRRAAERAGIDVVDALRAHAGRWYPLLPGARPGAPLWGVPYDVGTHPFAAQSVLDGRVTHRSREELAASVAHDPARAADVTAAIATLPRWGRDAGSEVGWVVGTLDRLVREGSVPDDADAARLLTALQDDTVRDVAWELMDRDEAPAHVAVWTDLLRRAPLKLADRAAALLGFAAWLAGHGALAWCALDRCGGQEDTVASLVAELLERAVPPDAWAEAQPRDRHDDSA